MASTNMLERLNEIIWRRTRVVDIFPNPDSYLRLVTTFLMEYDKIGRFPELTSAKNPFAPYCPKRLNPLAEYP